MRAYVPRPFVDEAILQRFGEGSGVFTLEGPAGAGKSTSLLHGLGAEAERRGPGGRGYVRLVQLWGDEPPSLFARRLVREATHLHLSSYPQPEKLRVLIEAMGAAVPGLLPAGKLLAALVPDDLRPLPQVALSALSEIGDKAVAHGGPLVLGIDLLGGAVADPTRDFLTRVADGLPPTVVMAVAQPVGQTPLVRVPHDRRILLGPFTLEEAAAYLSDVLGPLDDDGESLRLLASGQVSLLPGDLLQLTNLYPWLKADPRRGLSGVASQLFVGVAARYQHLYETRAERGGAEARAAELCAWVAVSARPEQPRTAEAALHRQGMVPSPSPSFGGALRELDQPTELWRLRRSELVQALCVTAPSIPSTGPPNGQPNDLIIGPLLDPGESDPEDVADTGWPLLPRHGQARQAVLAALSRHGVLPLYRKRWLEELLHALRTLPGSEGLLCGVRAFSVLLEQAAPMDPTALGQAVTLLGEMELHLWRAGWHRTFADLHDTLAPRLAAAGTGIRDVAPALFFRRARSRVQAVDWSADGGLSLAATREELPLAIEDFTALIGLSDLAVMQARLGLGLPVVSDEITRWSSHLPIKARQARGYARVLWLLQPDGHPREWIETTRKAALDDILLSLSHFAGSEEKENLAQTLTILADWYSAGSEGDDDLALAHYQRAVAVSRKTDPVPGFSLGVIYRSLGHHHHRRGRPQHAASAFDAARRWLLRSPESRMGTLLSGLLLHGSPAGVEARTPHECVDFCHTRGSISDEVAI